MSVGDNSGGGMNRFDLDHPMHVHRMAEPTSFAVPAVPVLRKSFPASADLFTTSAHGVLKSVEYPAAVWSISDETLDTIRRESPHFKLFIEIGTFIGQGVLAITRYFAAHEIQCPVVTVDTYAGTMLIDVGVKEKQLGFMRYFDRAVLGTFFTQKGLGETTFPVQATARDFFRKFYYLGMKASHIYLDASHEYLDTYEELKLAWECTEEGGVLAGDDYNWPTVKAAVDRFCAERRILYTITKGSTHEGITALQWVIAAKNSAVRHDDHVHNKQALA